MGYINQSLCFDAEIIHHSALNWSRDGPNCDREPSQKPRKLTLYYLIYLHKHGFPPTFAKKCWKLFLIFTYFSDQILRKSVLKTSLFHLICGHVVSRSSGDLFKENRFAKGPRIIASRPPLYHIPCQYQKHECHCAGFNFKATTQITFTV